MKVDGFPNCCGIHILTGFGKTRTAVYGGNNELGIKDIEAWMKVQERNQEVGLLLVALNQEQDKHYSKMMERLEYKPMAKDFYHYSHGNTITLYGKVITEENAKAHVAPQHNETSTFPKRVAY